MKLDKVQLTNLGIHIKSQYTNQWCHIHSLRKQVFKFIPYKICKHKNQIAAKVYRENPWCDNLTNQTLKAYTTSEENIKIISNYIFTKKITHNMQI